MSEIKVLFVCMGNICRSPTAQGVFQQLVESAGLSHAISVDSAGTHAYHVGEPPDPRAAQSALRRQVDLSAQRARKVSASDFEVFHYVLAMDLDNFSNLQSICPPGHEQKLSLFLDYAADVSVREVPDPYYGGATGFERVLDLIEAASHGLLEDIRNKHL
jgi:protein-tyrosine phosphatase